MTDDLWHRTAELVGVNYPERTIEVVVIPYEKKAQVEYAGRPVTEIISRGAFDGIERRANRIRANRDHQPERTIGRAVALHPDRKEGLVAEIRVARTLLGDETLELAEDGILDASAGFKPMGGGLQWETRDRYRITRAWLGHIAFTPDPAYPTANVLAVRSSSSAPASLTPNLDRARAMLADDRLQAVIASDPALNYQPL